MSNVYKFKKSPLFGMGHACRPFRNFHGFHDYQEGVLCACRHYRIKWSNGGWYIKANRAPIKKPVGFAISE